MRADVVKAASKKRDQPVPLAQLEQQLALEEAIRDGLKEAMRETFKHDRSFAQRLGDGPLFNVAVRIAVLRRLINKENTSDDQV